VFALFGCGVGCLRLVGRGWLLRVVGVLVVGLGLFGGLVGVAGAVVPAGGLSVRLFAPLREFGEARNSECARASGNVGRCFEYQVMATDSGSVESQGPIVVRDVLPPGLSVTTNEFLLVPVDPLEAEGTRSIVPAPEGECVEEGVVASGLTVKCTYPHGLAPDEALELDLRVAVGPEAVSGDPDTASASGASSPEAVVSEPMELSAVAPAFGPNGFVVLISGVDGMPYAQGGGHPYEMVTRLDLNSVVRVSPEGSVRQTSVQDLKDVVVELPLGVVGIAQATPKCAFSQLGSLHGCPADTRIGEILTEPAGSSAAHAAIYNLVPEVGLAAQFGFEDSIKGTHVFDASIVPTLAGYVLRATTREIPQISLREAIATFYGDPAARAEQGATQTAMFTNPSWCTGHQLVTSLSIDSWQAPGGFVSNGTPEGEPEIEGANWLAASSVSPAVTGCNELRFALEGFSVQPDTARADSPTGLTVEESIAEGEQPGTLATPPVRDETVTLPAGLIPNPAVASGITGCSEAQIGWLGRTLSNFTPAAPACPEASKLGSVEITTPALEKPVVGSLYLANQNEDPYNSVLGGYIVVDDPATGIIIKVPGRLSLNESTGQVTGVFDEAPQLGVFSKLKLRFFGGERGELATPESCGSYTTTGLIEPWSSSEPGPPVTNSFPVSLECLPGLTPSFSAATTSPQAGSYTPLELEFARQDDEQEITGATIVLPPGVTAKIAGVEKCSEADLQAAAANPSGRAESEHPSCPAASEVGSVTASSGVGPDPFYLPGKAYLTGGYKGAPLGLAVIVPAVAGPFDLGNVVVRSALYVNPSSAQVTAVSDAFPTIIDTKNTAGTETDGFADRLRSIKLTLNRNTYILNPTNCSAMAFAATFSAPSGLTSSTGSPFQVGGCRELAFKPGFAVSTQGHASKADGASLKVRITSAAGQANIGKLRLELPKQLPSRQTTLEKACLVGVFDANPAGCPKASLVGTATAISPLIATPFTGPAYLVSHEAKELPHLDVVLQSEGIEIILDSKIKITKGITTSIVETAPDAPVSSVELTFPEGPYSILGAFIPEKLHYNLCTQKLAMPTTITGQNGAILKQTTKITITGCPTHKTKAKHHTKKHKHTKH
jgi:hypothetical protein